MSKTLAIRASDFLKDGERFSSFYSAPRLRQSPLYQEIFLLDRYGPNGCDPKIPSVEPETYLQILPYNILYSKETNEIFCYSRGNSGGEKGLYGKCSIGVGGHPELHTTGDIVNVTDALAIEVVRELSEEVGMAVSLGTACDVADSYLRGEFSLVYDGQEDGDLNVGRRHLGIAMVLCVKKSEINMNSEIGVIDNAQWIDLNELKQKAASREIILESWSKILLDNMFKS